MDSWLANTLSFAKALKATNSYKKGGYVTTNTCDRLSINPTSSHVFIIQNGLTIVFYILSHERNQF